METALTAQLLPQSNYLAAPRSLAIEASRSQRHRHSLSDWFTETPICITPHIGQRWPALLMQDDAACDDENTRSLRFGLCLLFLVRRRQRQHTLSSLYKHEVILSARVRAGCLLSSLLHHHCFTSYGLRALIFIGVESLRPFPNHEFGFLLGRHPASTAKPAWYCGAVSQFGPEEPISTSADGVDEHDEVLAEPVNLLLDTSSFSSYSSLRSSLLARLECATQHQNKGSLSVRVRVDLFSPLYSTPLKPCIAFVLISTVNQSYMSIPT
jgi:hypothetical protein